jgi:hypothetical protein
MATLLGGCGGSDFEWFPNNGSFANSSTATAAGVSPGTVVSEIPFPAVVKWASDLVFDRSSATFWLLAGTTGTPDQNAPDALVQLNPQTGAVMNVAFASNWPLTILNGSTLTFDGVSFWVTSHGFINSVAASQVYQIAFNGANAVYFNGFYNCPATSVNAAGICQGLAWDGATASFWSAGSDNTKLANYNVASNISVSSAVLYSNIWSTIGVDDVAFDPASGEVLVMKGGVIRVSRGGVFLGTIPFSLPGTGRGDWDGQFFWVVDNSSKSMKAIFIR